MIEHFSHGPATVFLCFRNRSFQITGAGIPDQLLCILAERLEQLLLLIGRRLDDVIGQLFICAVIKKLVMALTVHPVFLYDPVEVWDPVQNDVYVDPASASDLDPIYVLTRDIYLLVLIPDPS